MDKKTEYLMLEYALKYSKKFNDKTGNPILDEKLTLPRGAGDSGSWFGFIIGFKLCYSLMSNKHDNDATRKTPSNNETVCAVQASTKTIETRCDRFRAKLNQE